MQMRSRVSWAVTARDYGRQCAVGEVVDLSARLPGGGTLADVTRPEWFEAVEQQDEPAPAVGVNEPGDPAEE